MRLSSPVRREVSLPDNSDLSDEDVVHRIRGGDAAAAAILFERHLPALRAKARATLPAALRPKVGESDVVQDAYLAAFLALADFEDRGDGSFLRWIRGILDHKIADELRRHVVVGKRDARREVRLPGSTAGGGIAALGQRSPSAEVVADEQAATLRAVIDSLPEEQATILRHVHLDGATIAEAGARMGKAPSASRKLYGRALTRLTEKLRGRAGPTSP